MIADRSHNGHEQELIAKVLATIEERLNLAKQVTAAQLRDETFTKQRFSDMADDLLLAYYPEMKRAEEVNVRRWTSQIRRYLQVGENLEEMRKDYEVALGQPGTDDLAGATLLVLTPKSKKIRAKLEQIRISLDPVSGLTHRVIYLEGDGDKTVFTFKDIQVNGEIDASRYKIALPPDVKMGDSFTAFASR